MARLALMTVISAAEILWGWFAEIQRHREGWRLVEAYERFQHRREAKTPRLDSARVDRRQRLHFSRLAAQRVRIGTPDLLIASVAFSLDAVVLSRNLRDFRQVPGLRVENWLD